MRALDAGQHLLQADLALKHGLAKLFHALRPIAARYTPAAIDPRAECVPTNSLALSRFANDGALPEDVAEAPFLLARRRDAERREGYSSTKRGSSAVAINPATPPP